MRPEPITVRAPSGDKIVLADMHSVVIGGNADVGAVVHDQSDAFAQRTPEFASVAQHFARGADLVAILNESGASSGDFAGILHDGSSGAQRRSKTGNINDGVELG